MFTRINKIYHEFPRLFWTVVTVSFIDGVGGTLLFPFFALYITQKFGVGMTQAGILLGISSLFGLVGSMVGGALTDKFGRKQLILFGLVFSAVSTLGFGFVNKFALLFPLVIVVGLLSSVAQPAHQAMIADILPEKQRQEGFGILRVVGNLAWIIGPTIGGFLANINFFYLFVINSIISCFVALIMPIVSSRSSVRGSVVMSRSTGSRRSTLPPTIRPKMSRSVRTPARRPEASHTKTESPVPVRWMARTHSASEVPGRTVTGCRRLSTRRRSSASEGTRRATAISVRSLTCQV